MIKILFNTIELLTLFLRILELIYKDHNGGFYNKKPLLQCIMLIQTLNSEHSYIAKK
jgi:hypothetical protein